MHPRVWIPIVALLAANCSGAEERGPSTTAAIQGAPGRAAGDGSAATVGSRRTIVFLGTSLTAGLGLAPEEAYPEVIQEKIDSAGLPFEVVNAGSSGETSAGALRRTDWLLRQPIDVLVLETGANDGLRALNIDSTRANIQSIIERVRAVKPEARVLLVQMEAPPNLGTRYTTRFRAMFPEVASATGAVLLPFLLEGIAGSAELNQGDGIHPTAEGARRAAAVIWPALERELRALSREPLTEGRNRP
jgi:acyl-CoA thioesterase-1